MLNEQPRIDTDALLRDLTEPQRQAVTHVDGPLLVLAGAGSGKTRVITRRAAYLATTAAQPYHVLAITFTNKAAGEMRDRIADLGVGRDMTVCTFHSLCARLLRIHHDRAGLAANFTIFDQDDRRRVVKAAVKACEFDPKNWPAGRVEARISRAKNALLNPEQFAQRGSDWTDRGISKIYAAYERILTAQHGLDFDDLLMRVALLLQDDGDLRNRLEQRYRYVLIDEYQDTNQAQYLIAHLLTQQHGNLCATGDPDQSIYGWRGANIKNILRFEEDHPGAAVVRLEQNYRSTKRILAAASSLISANVRRKEKTLWTDNAQGRCVRVVDCPDAEDEADYIAEEIAGAVKSGRQPADIAIFYRINALSLELELALRRAGVAYQVARGQAFYGRKEIKDLLAYVRVLVNPADATSLQRIINTPARGIGKTTIARLEAQAESTGRPLYDVLMDEDTRKSLGRSGERVARFAALLSALRPLAEGSAADALTQAFSQSGLRASLAGEERVDEVPLENVENLIAEAAKYDDTEPEGSLVGWLEQTSLVSDVDTIDETAGAVTLMTLHAAKGLEFPVVYIVGLEDGLLPFRRESDEHPPDIEEERRLCFVGMTRAKEELNLTHARYRLRHGQTLRNVSSSFLDELPAEEIEWCGEDMPSVTTGSRRRTGRGGPPQFDPREWCAGTLVYHEEHGIGQVLALRSGGTLSHVTVAFQEGGKQDFILEYADLTRLDPDEVD